MKHFRLPEDIHIQSIALKIEEKEDMIDFYKNQLGFVLKSEENNLSILGSKKKHSRLIILEQKSKNEKVKQRIPIRYSMLIPTENEFMCIAKRIFDAKYSINDFYRNEAYQVIRVKDPEENQIELICEEIKEDTLGNLNKIIDLKELADQCVIDIPYLTDEVTINKIYLPVANEKASIRFYKQILGMIDENQCLMLNNGNIIFHLSEGGNGFYIKENSYSTGINFYVLNMNSSKEIDKLAQHLKKEKIDFFVDQKKTILSIFDPNGIEWWFVRNKISRKKIH